MGDVSITKSEAYSLDTSSQCNNTSSSRLEVPYLYIYFNFPESEGEAFQNLILLPLYSPLWHLSDASKTQM